MNRSDPRGESTWHIQAAVAAWVVPGLGHFLLGERRRAGAVAAGIGLLWFTGLLLGGVSVFDHVEHKAWFLGQMLVAPSLAVDRYHQHLKARPLPAHGATPYEPSYGHIGEQGILFTALAGLLNLLCMIDVVYRDPKSRPAAGPYGSGTAQASGGRA